MNDKDIGCVKGGLANAKSPNQLSALGWNIFALVIVVTLFSLVHGWLAWSIVAAVAIGAGVVRWIWRKIVPPYGLCKGWGCEAWKVRSGVYS